MAMRVSRDFPFLTFKRFLTELHGRPLYRVPIDLGFGCPNRSVDGTGGCSFCPENGGRAKYTVSQDTVEEQVRTGVEFARRRYGARKFMAYAQAFTGTSAPIAEQRRAYSTILDTFPFDALSIGTRPDCLGDSVTQLLSELAERVQLWVELGIQTIHDRTLRRVNRGHDWETSRRAVLALDRIGIRTIAHVILGLPGETSEHWQGTADTLAHLPITGIKIHNLHVIKGTALARQFASTPFPVLNEGNYAAALIEFIRRLPPWVVIVRINTDTPEDQLVAPRWEMKKGQFRDHTVRLMRAGGHRQGDLFRGQLLLHVCCGPCAGHVAEVLGGDHDVTLFFSNSNIHPSAEYARRLDTARKLARITGLPLVEDEYIHGEWCNEISGLENEPEGGARCEACFRFSLDRAAQYARDHGFDCFTTSLSVSPHKDSQTVFRVGHGAGRFLAIDLKKDDGFRHSVELSRLHALYRQSYCGCEFSRSRADRQG